MKTSLVVLTPGKTKGRVIPISLGQFLIGRNAHCNLRPASSLISNRHCAILIRGEEVVVRDLQSTNGTFVNNEAVIGERTLKHRDRLRLGPLEFAVRIRHEPAPTLASDESSGQPGGMDDAAAALLLALNEGDSRAPPTQQVDGAGVPTGSTVFEVPAIPPDTETGRDEPNMAATPPPQPPAEDTARVADQLLRKYARRPGR
jgi:pSer/pThr/pTyr-binding forkhead associated (FHA) protein